MPITEVQLEELEELDTRKFSEFYVVSRDRKSHPSLVHAWPQMAPWSVIRDTARLHILVDDPEDRATIDAIFKRATS